MKTLKFFPVFCCLIVVFSACNDATNDDDCTNSLAQNAQVGDYYAVDLGLSVRWATCNIGAETADDNGDYFAWSEVTPKKNYSWESYENRGDAFLSASSIVGSEYDVAHMKWGRTWRMPTLNEMRELKTKCTWTWCLKNDVQGYKVKGSNGNVIFLPAGGYHYLEDSYYDGDYGCYWSGTLGGYFYAYNLLFNGENIDWKGSNRWIGCLVRPVTE